MCGKESNVQDTTDRGGHPAAAQSILAELAGLAHIRGTIVLI